MQLEPGQLESLIDVIYELCGVALDDTKGYLIESRLEEVAKNHGCESYLELIERASVSSEGTLRNAIVDAITTHETLFFRDTSPFEALKHKVLPEVFDRACTTGSGPQVRIWSAACSTGQEPYSIAMSILEMLPDASQWDIEITATDISRATVLRAERGEYSELEVSRGLPSGTLEKWFVREGRNWKICDRLKSMVRFQEGNLLGSPPGLGCFDVVFCRNVAIYFNEEDRRTAFENVQKSLVPGGYLFAGASENLADLGPEFQPETHCRSVFYRPTRSMRVDPIVLS